MQSVVAGQAPITLEWKKYLGSKNGGKKQKTSNTHSTTADTREALYFIPAGIPGVEYYLLLYLLLCAGVSYTSILLLYVPGMQLDTLSPRPKSFDASNKYEYK